MQPRQNVNRLTDIPNVGIATAKDFEVLGISKPTELTEKDPYQLYDQLCKLTQTQHDPCVIDVFIAAIRYMQGEPAQKWWFYTKERKKHLSETKF